MQLSKSEAQSLRQTIPFTPDQLKGMADMYLSGASIREVAEKYGLNRESVRHRISAQGVRMRDFKRQAILSDDDCAKILQMRNNGAKMADLSARFGVHEMTIKRAIWKARKMIA